MTPSRTENQFADRRTAAALRSSTLPLPRYRRAPRLGRSLALPSASPYRLECAPTGIGRVPAAVQRHRLTLSFRRGDQDARLGALYRTHLRLVDFRFESMQLPVTQAPFSPPSTER